MDDATTNDEITASTSDVNTAGGVGVMALNSNKAGMTGLDTQKINAIIESASKGSKFYAAKVASQSRIDEQIARLQSRLAALSEEEVLNASSRAARQAAGMTKDL